MTETSEMSDFYDLSDLIEYSTLWEDEIPSSLDITDDFNKIKIFKIWHYDRSKKIEINMDYISKKPGCENVDLSEIPTFYLFNPKIVVTIQLKKNNRWRMVFTLDGEKLYSRNFCNTKGFFLSVLLSAIRNGWDYRPYMPESRSKRELIEQVNRLTETLANLV